MKIELHSHCVGFSNCGKLTPEELVDLYCAKQYDVLVLTNHFNRIAHQFYTDHGGNDFHRDYHDCIRYTRKIAAPKNLLVLGAYELRFDENDNDYLCFGMTEDFCRDLEWIFTRTSGSFGSAAKENGFLFYQAHPFRNGLTVVPPEHLFGFEVQNTHPRHDSRNDIALAWAEKDGMHKIADYDCHQPQDAGTSAIMTDYPVKSIGDLVHVLRNDLYTMIQSE